jgi:hypothetical protein
MMDTTAFYDQVMIAMAQPADQRHTQLARLHAEALRSSPKLVLLGCSTQHRGRPIRTRSRATF